MGRAKRISIPQTLTMTFVFFYVASQADCLGVRDQKTARLTTFGNSNVPNNNKPTTTTQAPSGKECRGDADCQFVQNATCKKDPHDGKMRCLCADKSAPRAASCKHSKTGLHARCVKDDECIENSMCKLPPSNATTSNNPSYKSCMCKEGFEEEDHACSSGMLTTGPSRDTAILLLFLFPVLQLIKY